MDQMLPTLPALPPDSHKGTRGRVLCVAGSRTMPGASVLVARAAQRAGAGLVCMGALDRELLLVLPGAAPEAVLVDLAAEFPDTGAAGPGAARALWARDPHARLVGPGIGDDARARSVLRAALEEPRRPLVIDADGLNALEGEPERLAARHGDAVVITPHAGEAERLSGRPVPVDDPGRGELAAELARRAGAICVLKGPHTVVSDGERTWRSYTGNWGMATAGSGDVLAGVLVAYLALVDRPFAPSFEAWDAVRLAVHVHGLAGDLAARERGPRALIASDLVASLALAQRELEG
jgi:NAD(P)H-hydrate epimerase